jgi:tetratricopeptide (TPR) repeat protein
MMEDEGTALDELARRFLDALNAKDAGRSEDAEDALRAILRLEPRLPEPRLELARILLDSDRLGEAEDEAREGLEHLANSGPWSEDLEPDQVTALGKALLAEVLRRRAEEDDVVFGDPAEFAALVAEAKALFTEAARLDPSDEYSSYHAFFMGTRGEADPDADLVPGRELDPEPEVDD